MATRSVQESSLTSLADAIRAKGGTSDTLTFPGGFVSAVEAIDAGGGGDDGSFKAVIERTAVNPTIPSDLTSIGQYAFYYCTNLALTSLPAGVTSIRDYAFFNCFPLALTSLPAGVTSIRDYAFYNCNHLALTSFPAGVTSIGQFAFYNCNQLTSISFPAGVTSIGQYAFFNCTGIKKVTFEGIPTGKISSYTFKGCTNLTVINVPWAEGAVQNAPWSATNATINYNYTGEA